MSCGCNKTAPLSGLSDVETPKTLLAVAIALAPAIALMVWTSSLPETRSRK